MDKRLATQFVTIYGAELVVSSHLEAGGHRVFHARTQQVQGWLDEQTFSWLGRFFEPHTPNRYGNYFPNGFTLNQAGYLLAKFWLAKYELEESGEFVVKALVGEGI
jgi:hypothetical protein